MLPTSVPQHAPRSTEEIDVRGDDDNDDEEDDNDRDDGRLLSWGCGEFGQHCHGHQNDVTIQDGVLEEFSDKNRVKDVACGASHTLAVTESNEIYAWGNGNSGQLGTDTTESQFTPQKIQLFENQAKGITPPVAGIACGGRHSMVWLTNGNVFSFGNNYYAQLGYDFREKYYKENQAKPTLLKFLVYRPVVQVSCGEKHSVFRFHGGAIACIGCNANGQIGMGSREEAVVPKMIDMDRPIKYIDSGANHNLAITDNGEAYGWGYGKALGSKTEDILSPERIEINTQGVSQVAGGGYHSIFLTESGTVLTLGSGADGQLGFGDNVYFLNRPRRLVQAHLRHRVVQICAGESYSAAVTENGEVYMWGKNSHVIQPERPPSHRIWNPVCINQRTKPVKSLHCGSWHAVAVTGFPAPLVHDCSDSEDSISDMESRVNGVHQNGDIKGGDSSSESEEDFSELPHIAIKRDPNTQDKEGTKLSIAEFYAQEDDGMNRLGGLESPNAQRPTLVPPGDTNLQEKPESARSRIVVQVPTPNVVHVATSPIPFSDSESGSERAASPVKEVKHQNIPSAKSKASHQTSAKNTTYEYPSDVDRIPYQSRGVQYSYEREKSCVSSHNHPAPIVQVSKTTAGMFALPRENTNFTSKQIDLTEVEYARAVSSTKSPEKQYWMNKLQDARSVDLSTSQPNPLSLVPQDTSSHVGNGSVSVTGRQYDNASYRHGRHSETSVINLGHVERLLDGTPSKWTKSSMSDYGKHFGTPEILEEARRAAKLPPRTKPTSSIPRKKTDANFVLQISRSDTVIAPMKGPFFNAKMKNLKLTPLERYASVHNPLGGSKINEKKSKSGIQTARNVSIPGGRVGTGQEGDFCVQGQTGVSVRAMYSSAGSWKDKGDLQRIREAKLSSSTPVLTGAPSTPGKSQSESARLGTDNNAETRKDGKESVNDTHNDKENDPLKDKPSTSREKPSKPERDGILSRSSDKSVSKNVSFVKVDKTDSGNQRRSSHRKGFGIHRGKWQTSLPQTG